MLKLCPLTVAILDATMSINRNQHKNQLKKIQKNPLEYIAIKFDT
jgi:hypothetical protein